jgi:hypothetical protein
MTEFDQIIEAIQELHQQYPDQRFFQLLFNYSILGSRTKEIGAIVDPFYYEDKSTLNSLKKNL